VGVTPPKAAFVLLLVFATPVRADDTDEAAIRQLWQRFEEAYNSHDALKVVALYAPDGDRINGELETAKGRGEIAAQYEQEFAKDKANPTSAPAHSKIAIRLVDSRVAILDGEFEDVRDGKRLRGQFTAILRKDSGGWRIAAGRVRGVKLL
jgi:uncharacterized protein (TIGR02246 family)